MTTASPPVTLVWFRRDLRLTDNPAWQAAAARGAHVVPVFIWAPDEEDPWAPGAASRWWLHHSLESLQESLRTAGTPLVIRRGPSRTTLQQLVQETGATAVFWNRLYEPVVLARDQAVKLALRAEGIDARSFNSALLFEPWTIQTQQGKPYQVFTPFYRACQSLGDPSRPAATPVAMASGRRQVPTETLASLALLPEIPWADGLRAAWNPGEGGARSLLNAFSAATVAHYGEQRDHPAIAGTSRLSPHLHFGEVSPRQIWWTVRAASHGGRAEPYLRQLIWREFAHHLLYHFPHTPSEPLRPEFKAFPWRRDQQALRAWQRGRTGFPIVDAGMRELWHTGWMHNRVRMIAASFLVKDLMISWREGAAWFWDTLVDADLANNTLGWQWTAGCGADAAPYFRVFNPTLQGEKFDPDGRYVGQWIPERKGLPSKMIHRPRGGEVSLLSGDFEQRGAYPSPVVDHGEARERALDAYAAMRGSFVRPEKD